MIRTTIIAAIALGAVATSAAAEARDAPRATTATWHPDAGPEGRYCVRSTHLETAAMTGTRIYQRACRSARAWRAVGITFQHRTPRG